MLPAWFFSALILGSVLGSPLYFNNTQNSTSDDVLIHPVGPLDNSSTSTNECKGLSCGSSQNDPEQDPAEISSNGTEKWLSIPVKKLMTGCLLPTCAVHHLSNRLQSGDEKAGNTFDPYGIGKR